MGWPAAAHPRATWTASVCTSSLCWPGAVVGTRRVVIDGNVITGAAVSAGIDLGLRLAAATMTAQTCPRIRPEPPFDTCSPGKAPPHPHAVMSPGSEGNR